MLLEAYQTVGATVGIAALVGVIVEAARMSWKAMLKIGLVGLVCVAAAWLINSDRDVRRAEEALTSPSVNDPECRTVNGTVNGDTERWVVVCPKQSVRPL